MSSPDRRSKRLSQIAQAAAISFVHQAGVVGSGLILFVILTAGSPSDLAIRVCFLAGTAFVVWDELKRSSPPTSKTSRHNAPDAYPWPDQNLLIAPTITGRELQPNAIGRHETSMHEDKMRETVIDPDRTQNERQREALSYTMLLIAKRFGSMPPSLHHQLQTLSADQLERLGQDLFDFTSESDLQQRLDQFQSQL